MSENLRNWMWFLSVVTAMTVGPILIGSLAVYGLVTTYRRYRGIVGEKLRSCRTLGYGH